MERRFKDCLKSGPWEMLLWVGLKHFFDSVGITCSKLMGALSSDLAKSRIDSTAETPKGHEPMCCTNSANANYVPGRYVFALAVMAIMHMYKACIWEPVRLLRIDRCLKSNERNEIHAGRFILPWSVMNCSYW